MSESYVDCDINPADRFGAPPDTILYHAGLFVKIKLVPCTAIRVQVSDTCFCISTSARAGIVAASGHVVYVSLVSKGCSLTFQSPLLLVGSCGRPKLFGPYFDCIAAWKIAR